MPGCPFNIDNDEAYARWRSAKLEGYPKGVADIMVSLRDPLDPRDSELKRVVTLCAKANMAILRGAPLDEAGLLALARRLGLTSLDQNMLAGEEGISAIAVADDALHRKYIPYTDRALGWHTDGYYNHPDLPVRSVLLHCISEAEEGGGNGLLDPEMAYIRLRDRDPAHIRTLMEPDVLTIPANKEAGQPPRPERVGPVFSVVNGSLRMRFTDRTRNIKWKDGPGVKAALEALHEIFNSGDPCVFRHTLKPGQTLISNNVLHCREAFRDGGVKRKLLRARFHEPVQTNNKNNSGVAMNLSVSEDRTGFDWDKLLVAGLIALGLALLGLIYFVGSSYEISPPKVQVSAPPADLPAMDFKTARASGDPETMRRAVDILWADGVLKKGMSGKQVSKILGLPDNTTMRYVERGYSTGYGIITPTKDNYDQFFWLHFQRGPKQSGGQEVLVGWWPVK